MEELTIKIPVKEKEELEKIASKNGLTLKRFIELMATLFPEDGKLYSGQWYAGGKGAKRFIIDWPKFSSPVVTLKKEELA